MSKQFFRLLFGTMLFVAAAAFTACTDDDKTEAPELTANPTVLNFTTETALTQTVAITANCEWKVTTSGLEWATVTPAAGKGNATLSVTVGELPTDVKARTGKISFTMIHPEFGPWGTAESTVTVNQAGEGGIVPPPDTDPIYFNNFDKETATQTYGTDNKYWPYLDQSDCWQNQTGTGASTVAYEYKSMSARANQSSNGSYADDDYKAVASGANNLMAGSGGYFVIKNITLPAGKTNFALTFGAMGEYKTDFAPSMLKVELSADATNWVSVSYTRSTSQNWGLATADFTLKESVSTLSIRFTPVQNGRFDDVKLLEGIGGQEIDLKGGEPGPEPGDAVKTTIPELIAKCEAAGSTQAVIDATNDVWFEAVVVTDKDGGNTVSNNLMVMTEGAKTEKNGITLYGSGQYTNPADENFTFKVGDKVKVTLKAGQARVVTFSGLYEITGSVNTSWVEIVKTGTATVTPIEITAADLIKYQAMPVTIKNVTAPATAAAWCTAEAAGTHSFSAAGTALTVYVQKNAAAFAGQTFTAGATGSISGNVALYKGAAQVAPRTLADVADFMNGGAATPSITVNPASLSFVAAGETKTVTVTKTNADDCTIAVSVDNAQFTATESNGTVTVVAKENTAETAVSATLTVSLMKDGKAVDSKTVALSQAAKSTGGSTGGETGEGQTITFTIDDIKAGGTNLPVNSYGSQAVATPSTWYTWTTKGIEFSGVKICEANGSNAGTLQMQGNASDVSKQGFFGNVTSLGKISKIVVVSVNEKYDPSVNLYVGTEAHPTTNKQARPTFTKDGNVYTEEYAISGDNGYFRLWNDSVGATYVKSISVTYTK